MNEVEEDFLRKIARNMDINDIVLVLGINEEELVEAFSERILATNKYYEFKEFLGEDYSFEESEEI